jgi:hypothetical protein
MSDRTAARANRTDIDRRGAHNHVADRRFAPQLSFALLHQRDVGGRATHVEGQEITEAGLLSEPDSARHPAGGPAHQHLHRILSGCLGRG